MSYFNIYRRLESETNFTQIATNVTGTQYVDETVTEGLIYFYKVGSVVDEQESLSAEIKASSYYSDRYYANVLLLTYADSTPAKLAYNTVVKNSKNNATFTTTAGTPVVLKSMTKTGNVLCLFPARVSVPIPALNRADFTLRLVAAVDPNASNMWGRLLMIGNNSTNGAIYLHRTSNLTPFQMRFDIHTGGSYSARIGPIASTPTLEYAEYCLMRKSGIFYLFKDGVLQGTDNAITTFSITGTTLYLGQNNSGSESCNMILDYVQLDNGALFDITGYTTTLERPEILSSCVVRLQSLLNGIGAVDKSAANRTVTISGNYISTSPAQFNDGVLYFNGSSVASAYIEALGFSDFTIEMDINLRAKAPASYYPRIFQIGNNLTEGALFLVLYANTNQLFLDLGVANGYIRTINRSVNTELPVLNNAHLCLMRKDNTFYLFINGILVGSAYREYNITHTAFRLGGANNVIYECSVMQVSNVRITKLARYSSEGFTPPNYKLPMIQL